MQHKSIRNKTTEHISFQASWYGAVRYCRQHNLNLVSITTREESDRLKALIAAYGETEIEPNTRTVQQHSELFLVLLGLSEERLWIGGTDLGDSRNFYWIGSGQPILNFTDWHPGEPNSIQRQCDVEHCMELFKYRDVIAWNDSPCNDGSYFICET